MPPLSAPVLMIAGGAVFLLVAIKVLFSQRRIVEVVPYSKSTTTIELPSKWDDNEVTRLLQRYQDQPSVLSHAVSSLKTRLVMNQDLKTAQKRLKLIASVIELFKLNQALQGILYDIHMAEKDFEIRQVETQLRLEDARDRLKSEGYLRQLRSQRDELQLQKEIAELRRDTDSIARPARPDPPQKQQPSIDELIVAQEGKIKRYQEESAERQKNAGTPPEAQKWKVFYEDLIYDAQEELKKLLRRR